MEVYIRSASMISPQPSFGSAGLPAEIISSDTDRMNCVEPDYARIIDPKAMRRMSRIIRMGVASALDCLKQSGLSQPDAIITGSAYGCLEDTEVFLKKMVENQEELLTPTAFIQSTHNTVGAQIALLLQCHNYNNTHVHRGFSFENALLDAMLLLQEEEAKCVLTGGLDEITATSHRILSRFGLYREQISGSLLSAPAMRCRDGEGSGFFLLTTEESEKNIARLDGMSSFYRPAGPEDVQEHISSFLQSLSLKPEDLDLIISGDIGNPAMEEFFKGMRPGGIPLLAFKSLSGEYPTASAFALWLATRILATDQYPDWTGAGPAKVKKILVYNHFQYLHHSLYLLSAC